MIYPRHNRLLPGDIVRPFNSGRPNKITVVEVANCEACVGLGYIVIAISEEGKPIEAKCRACGGKGYYPL